MRSLGFLVILILLAAAWSSPPARADVVHLVGGGRLEGKVVEEKPGFVVLETRFGRQRIERARIARIEKGETLEERIRRLAARAEKGADLLALARQAGEAGLRRLERELLLAAVERDPDLVEAQRALGRVPFEGRWVTPQERDRLVAEKRRRELERRGLVEYEGRFVTPEEKEKLESGLVLVDGEWVDRDEAMRRRGFVRRGGEWVRAEDAWVEETRSQIGQALGLALEAATSEHVAVLGDVDPAFLETLCELLEEGYRRFAAEFEAPEGLGWLGGRRIDFLVFRTRFSYEKFVDWVGAQRGMGRRWAERARRVSSVYRFDDAWCMAATYLANRGQKHVAHHLVNMLGHILIQRFGRPDSGVPYPVPPFFDEGFTAWFEHALLGRNVVFTRGAGRYERHLSDEDRRFFEDGDWLEAFRGVLRRNADTPLEIAIRRGYAELSQSEVAKAMALVERWHRLGEGRLRRFFRTLRRLLPPADAPPNDPRIRGAIVAAVEEVEEAAFGEMDLVLRRFAMQPENGRRR